MCGIAGFYNLNGSPVNVDLLRDMTGVLSHRGPDDEGFYHKGPVGLGHRRLSIIDLSQGHQPMCNEDETVWIVFNGEIYNFQDIKAALEGKGHRFRTHCDTEVIVHAYEEYGERCVERFNGMFAFAIWDERNKTLFLARDRIGIKPLYYYTDGKRVIFSSEIKSILQDPTIDRSINYHALADYFSIGYIPSPKSVYNRISKLEPGHCITIREQGITKKEYWDLSFAKTVDLSRDEHKKNIIDLLKTSVKMRLISDVPLGAFLSGGVDSSAVVALMAEITGSGVKTSSIGFEEEAFSELKYAEEVSKLFNTDHHTKTLKPDALQTLKTLVWHYDEPFADYSMIPTYYVSKITRENVTVALSGDGGDENFAGYRGYRIEQNINRIRNAIPPVLRQLLIKPLSHIYPKADYLPQVFRGKQTFKNLATDHIHAYFYSKSITDPELLKHIYSGHMHERIRGYDTSGIFEKYAEKSGTKDPLSVMQYIDFKTYLCDDILTKVDRASMAVSLEVRVPILDHNFVEYVMTIPSDLKIKGGEQKYVFKEALKSRLPENILSRHKQGFTIPIAEWLRRDMKEFAEDIVFNKPDSLGVFDYKKLKKLWDRHQRRTRDYSFMFWSVLVFRAWEERFLK